MQSLTAACVTCDRPSGWRGSMTGARGNTVAGVNELDVCFRPVTIHSRTVGPVQLPAPSDGLGGSLPLFP